VEIIQATDEMVAANNEFVQKDVGVIEQQFKTEYGVRNVGAKIEEIRALIDHWKTSVADVESEEELAQLYWNEIFAKLDPARYGMK
jgi:hypothetical protein